MKEESLKTFLKGTWKRIETTYFGERSFDSDDYPVYVIYNDTSSIFYGFRKNYNNQYILENHLISWGDYSKSSIKKSRGKVILGFEGWYSDDITWKDLVENTDDEEFLIIRLSNNKLKIIFSKDPPYNEETYVRLSINSIPDYLKEILD